MGLKNLIKGQLLSSISYRSSDPQELAAVYDRDGRRIMYESVLTVMPGQGSDPGERRTDDGYFYVRADMN